MAAGFSESVLIKGAGIAHTWGRGGIKRFGIIRRESEYYPQKARERAQELGQPERQGRNQTRYPALSDQARMGQNGGRGESGPSLPDFTSCPTLQAIAGPAWILNAYQGQSSRQIYQLGSRFSIGLPSSEQIP